jgi:glycosyltransferase involved in cell wall biosynthesis
MNIISPINQLGYGITSLNIVKELSKLTKIALWPIGQPQITNEQDAQIIQSCINNSQTPNFNDPCMRIWHQHDMSQFVGKGQHIGFPIFELNQFNNIEKHHLNSLDKIFVCSEWARQICINNLTVSPDNIKVVPLGVDIEIFQPSAINNNGPTIFLNCGKWEVRKGHDVLPEIFSNAFEDSDNVELWMMCDNPFLSTEETNNWKKLYTSSKLGHKIRFINRKNTQLEVYNIMKLVDCGIFPSKAEGWNLEILELLSCGKHVITTKYSAHTEFCNESNSRLVNIDEEEIAYDGKWFKSNVGSWAKLSKRTIDDFSLHMRNIYQQKKHKSLDTNIEGINTASKFTWSNSAQKVLSYV